MEQSKEKINFYTQQTNNRNGLIEMYRFLFALWVVWYHGYFLFKNEYFSHGYIAVEFFFILSGFYILKSIDKLKNETFFSGLGKLLWNRTKSLGLAFVIGLIFVFWYMIIVKEISILGFLWYIPLMLLAFVVIYTLTRIIKNKYLFITTLICIVIVSYLLLYIPILQGWGLFRSLGGVSLGVLISLIPQINLNFKKINFNWIITIMLFVLTLYLAYLPKENLNSEYLLVLIIMPMLIYFTNTLQINSKILNFLGSISFGLYSYQCVLRVIEFYFIIPQYWYFAILVILVLLDKFIISSYKKHRMKLGG